MSQISRRRVLHAAATFSSAAAYYHDMMVTIRDRVQKLKTAGRSLADVKAAKPSADFDAAWGKGGMFDGDAFVEVVFNTL